MKDNVEPRPQRRSQHSGPRSRADEREFWQLQFDRPCRRALADHDVEAVIFHRRIEDFLDCGIEPVDLVDKEYVAFLEAGKNRREIPGFFYYGSACGFERGPHFVGYDIRESGLADARRAGEQDVVECLAPLERGLHKHAQVLFDLSLADVFAKMRRTQRRLEAALFGCQLFVADINGSEVGHLDRSE